MFFLVSLVFFLPFGLMNFGKLGLNCKPLGRKRAVSSFFLLLTSKIKPF